MKGWKKIALWAVALLIVGISIVAAIQVGHIGTTYRNIDFNLRYNEVKAVLRGSDPFLVWKGVLPSCGCTPLSFSLLPLWPNVQFIHAYPPWSYVPLLPFGLMPYEPSLLTYRLLMGILLLAVLAVAFWRIYRHSRQWGMVVWAFLLMVLCARDGVYCCFVVGNMGVIVAFSVYFALLSHECGRDVLAGFFWSLAMIKPQLSVLLLLVVLLERKWTTLAVVAALLSVCTLVVASMCGRPPWEMILSIREYSVGMFHMTGLIPDAVRKLIWRTADASDASFLMSVNAMLGVILCVFAWWIGRRARSLWIRFLPAVVLSLGWSAYRLHDFSLQIVPVFVAMMVIAGARTKRLSLSAFVFCALLGVRMALYEDWLFPYVNWLSIVATFWLVLEAKNEALGDNPLL